MILDENFIGSMLTVRKRCWERGRSRRRQACVASLLRRHVLVHEERGEHDGAVKAEHKKRALRLDQRQYVFYKALR